VLTAELIKSSRFSKLLREENERFCVDVEEVEETSIAFEKPPAI